MPKITQWSGDKHAEDFLSDETNSQLISFCRIYKSVYVFGAGKIGNGFKCYLEQSGIVVTGFITSDIFEEWVKNYEQGQVGVVIGVSDKFLVEIMPLLERFVLSKDIFLANCEYRERIGQQFSIQHIKDNFRVHVYLASHCNISCKGCRSFSPINRPEFYTYEEYEKDIHQLLKLDLHLNYVCFTGGEPLLNPDLFQIFRITRLLYPSITIRCFTNGVLLAKFTTEQLKKLIEFNVEMVITKYPIKGLNLANFYQKADELGVKYNVIYFGEKKIFSTPKIDFQKNTELYDFYNCFCYKRSTGLQMYRGKLYQCVICLFQSFFNEHFKTNLAICEKDFIDIYNTNSEEIYKYKITRIPFCDYCNNMNKSLFEWGISKKKIEEWT